MTRFQLALIATLILLPLLLFGGFGAWALWNNGHLIWLSWTLPVCWTLAWFMTRKLTRIEIPLPEVGSRAQWTPQDQAAAKIVELELKRVSDEAKPEELTDLNFFRSRTLDLATKLAAHYHPSSTRPLEELSVIEILAVVHLVSEDVEETFRTSVPASHLITVKQWREWSSKENRDKVLQAWSQAKNAWWVISAVMASSPAAMAGKYALTKLFADPLTQYLQEHGQYWVLSRFFMLYMRQLGFYLIELNSGRLRGGSARYRKAMGQLEGAPSSASAEPVAVEPVTVTIAVVGQVKAGKSSLVNCFLRGQQAATDILPLTKDVDRYQLTLEESSDRLILLDTPGYSDSGATREQIAATHEAVRQADLVLLVMAATSPAKQADAAMLADLKAWFQAQHRLKPPSVAGVVSRIDGLSPLMEWLPPYDWESGSRPKEKSIRDAVEYARETVGSGMAGVVPVCAARDQGRVFGVEEWLLPLITVLLDEARAVSLVRTLHADYDRNRLQVTISQFLEAGRRMKQSVVNALRT